MDQRDIQKKEGPDQSNDSSPQSSRMCLGARSRNAENAVYGPRSTGQPLPAINPLPEYNTTLPGFAYPSYTGSGTSMSPYSPVAYTTSQNSDRPHFPSTSQDQQLPELPPFVPGAFTPRTVSGLLGVDDPESRRNHASQHRRQPPPQRPEETKAMDLLVFATLNDNQYAPATKTPEQQQQRLQKSNQEMAKQRAHRQNTEQLFQQRFAQGNSSQHSRHMTRMQPATSTYSQQDPTAQSFSQSPGPPGPQYCSLCWESLENTAANFPYRCGICVGTHYCVECLKDWFIDACKNESKMPPRCCSIIPLSALKDHLEVQETNLYKVKFEEWNTPNRIYCPVLNCSTFIPPRLIQRRTKDIISSVEHREAEGRVIENGLNPLTSQARSPGQDIISAICPTCSTFSNNVQESMNTQSLFENPTEIEEKIPKDPDAHKAAIDHM
ncbi:hypothetical protein VTL71DRAFT_12829 [Oculimacula yallundae]|uniref:RING-type domain-containing protein n=1 Tax=Oculimacula yallundae TaxID=86028 RepID=A0ABR4CP43_9HELO